MSSRSYLGNRRSTAAPSPLRSAADRRERRDRATEANRTAGQAPLYHFLGRAHRTLQPIAPNAVYRTDDRDRSEQTWHSDGLAHRSPRGRPHVAGSCYGIVGESAVWLWVLGLWVATIGAVIALARPGRATVSARQIGAVLLDVLSLTLLICIGPRRGRRPCPTCRFYIPVNAAHCRYCARTVPAPEGAPSV